LRGGQIVAVFFELLNAHWSRPILFRRGLLALRWGIPKSIPRGIEGRAVLAPEIEATLLDVRIPLG
jgi:hypothetical protein